MGGLEGELMFGGGGVLPQPVPPGKLDELALAALDEASECQDFDAEILQTAPVRDIRHQIENVIGLLEKLDHRALIKRQNWLSKLTGADIEARLEFELSAQKVMLALQSLRQATESGERLIPSLNATRDVILEEQDRLNAVITAAKDLLAHNPDADPFLKARFERRLASIVSLHVANIATVEQLRMAVDIMVSVLDRCTDVETLLFPVWQRNVLALAHASAGSDRNTIAQEYASSREQLLTFLKRGITA